MAALTFNPLLLTSTGVSQFFGNAVAGTVQLPEIQQNCDAIVRGCSSYQLLSDRPSVDCDKISSLVDSFKHQTAQTRPMLVSEIQQYAESIALVMRVVYQGAIAASQPLPSGAARPPIDRGALRGSRMLRATAPLLYGPRHDMPPGPIDRGAPEQMRTPPPMMAIEYSPYRVDGSPPLSLSERFWRWLGRLLGSK